MFLNKISSSPALLVIIYVVFLIIVPVLFCKRVKKSNYCFIGGVFVGLIGVTLFVVFGIPYGDVEVKTNETPSQT